MINGDICINKQNGQRLIFEEAEAPDRPKDDSEIDIVLFEESTGESRTITLEEFNNNWDIPEPREEPVAFTRALRDGRITREKCTMAISSNQTNRRAP